MLGRIVVEHRITFSTEERARRFVEFVLLMLREDVALFRDGLLVIVLDGAEVPRTEQILRLAKMSAATWAAIRHEEP